MLSAFVSTIISVMTVVFVTKYLWAWLINHNVYSFHAACFGFPILDNTCILPYAARIVLWTCNYCVAFVIKRARKDFVFVTFQNLYLVSSLSRPNSASFVATCRNDFIALRIELNFWDFVFVALKKGDTGSRKYIVNSRQSVCWCCR